MTCPNTKPFAAAPCRVIFNATRAAALQRAAAGRGGSAGVLAPDEELEYSALEFVMPQRRVDISYLSGVGEWVLAAQYAPGGGVRVGWREGGAGERL